MNPVLILELSSARAEIEKLKLERDLYAELAGNRSVIKKVIDLLGPQTLTSTKRFKELEQAEAMLKKTQEERDAWRDRAERSEELNRQYTECK